MTGVTATFRQPSFDVLDADMTPADIVETLERIKFYATNQLRTVKIDEPVRDYLLDALRRKP